ncbi:MAG: hypothetical protein OXB96_02560 [Candidatus Kaiserbacteria bacterium]|nr:hypothetical protein [Candidatus Kaiserbacteria bacterium]
MFRLWSETNKEARKNLKPDFEMRGWDDLSKAEKSYMWNHLVEYLFHPDIRKERDTFNYGQYYSYYEFACSPEILGVLKDVMCETASLLNQEYKVKCPAKEYLVRRWWVQACWDFHNIFMNQREDVVMEMLSIFISRMLDKQRLGESYVFGSFERDLNDTFLQFGVKYHLTRSGFMPRQDKKIIEEIYEPVLSCLSDQRWDKVNNELIDAFNEYRKNTPQGYSGCVTHTYSAIQAFLQIIVNGRTGKGGVSKLMQDAMTKDLIPNDKFARTIFKNIENIFAFERSRVGDPHPKEEYADEKTAKMILNLAMVFIQHCIQK